MIDTILDNIGMSDDADALPEIGPNLDSDIDDSSMDSSLFSSESVNSNPLNEHTALLNNSMVLEDSLPITSDDSIGKIQSSANLDRQVIDNIHNGTVDESASFASTLDEIISTPTGLKEQPNTMQELGISSIDVDNFLNTPTTDSLEVSNEDFDYLQDRAEGIERCEHRSEISFGKKMCPTRHGCQGATDCDYCGGDYPG